MGNSKKTFFNPVWLQKQDYKAWLAPVPTDKSSAQCKLCQKIFSLSNMGEPALVSHMSSQKHKKSFAATHSLSIMAFYGNVGGESSVAAQSSASTSMGQSLVNTNSDLVIQPLGSTSSGDVIQLEPCSTKKEPKGLNKFLLKDDVTKAEILWCLYIIRHHNSKNSSGQAVSLFPKMFPDSEIASKMQLQRTKISYTINYGLAPYFLHELQRMCDKCAYIVVGFDESLNKIVQKSQMDVFIRFWDSEIDQVCSRYYSSSFLGHSTSADLLRSFLEATDGINLKKILQVSMDGPKVNIKFLRELNAELNGEKGPGEQKNLLSLGSCGLHTVHNAYKKAMKTNEWKILEFLRSLHYLFCYSPARREDYVKFSGSTVFPLKFCAVRWVENFDVAARALNILPNVHKYIESVKKEKKEPSCNSYKIVCSAIKDPLLPAKIAFFQTVAADVQPFLKRFQSNEPLAPFLYESLLDTTRAIMNRFIKSTVLQSTSNIVQIDLSNNDLFKYAKEIDVGFTTRKVIRNVVKPVEELRFRNECRNALLEFCRSLLNISPLKYSLTKGISCFDPAVAIKPSIRNSRLNKALDCFVENNWLTGTQADCIKRSFTQVCSQPMLESKMENFTGRLDAFWLNIIPCQDEFLELRSFVKSVLILSHGNAYAEQGFSINKEMLLDNLSTESIIAQRQVYDALMYYGEIEKVEINKSLIQAARNASGYYKEALKKKREVEDEEKKLKAMKRKASEEIKLLEEKKKNILKDAEHQIKLLNSEINKLV